MWGDRCRLTQSESAPQPRRRRPGCRIVSSNSLDVGGVRHTGIMSGCHLSRCNIVIRIGFLLLSATMCVVCITIDNCDNGVVWLVGLVVPSPLSVLLIVFCYLRVGCLNLLIWFMNFGHWTFWIEHKPKRIICYYCDMLYVHELLSLLRIFAYPAT